MRQNSKSIKRIAVLVDTSSSSGRGVLTGILNFALLRQDWHITIFELTKYGIPSIRHAMKTSQIDGIITSVLENDALVNDLSKTQTPLVVIGTRNTCVPGRKSNIAQVTSDEQALGRVAARHFMRLGKFKSYGYIPMRESFCKYLSSLREQGFREELNRNNLTRSTFYSHIPECRTDMKALGKWLASLVRPTAVLACYDKRAADAIRAALSVGLSIPQDIRILGIDNDEFTCLATRPPLSSIIRDTPCEGRTAAMRLEQLMKHSRTRVFPLVTICANTYEIVTRGTTDVLPPGINLVQRACEFISRNASRKLTPDDVVAALHVSKRLLYLRFKQYSDTSLQSVIDHARIENLKKELCTSKRNIRDICTGCGFPDNSHIKETFRHHTGTTMSEWRKTHRSNLNPALFRSDKCVKGLKPKNLS